VSNGGMKNLAELPLHDASLLAVHVVWADGRCVLQLETGDRGEVALVFSGVTEANLPRNQPWGPSTLINAMRKLGHDAFEVELQSGDVLRMHAAAWELVPGAWGGAR